VKAQLINILAGSAGNPSCAIDVVDCTDHESGRGQDAFFISQQMLPCMRTIETAKNLIDLVVFNQAYNMQKASDLLLPTFHWCSLIIGIEHTTNLLIGTCINNRPTKELCLFAKLVGNFIIS